MDWLANFSAGLLSTFVGVIIGVPFALWLNRKNLREVERQRRDEERALLARYLQSIERALGSNIEALNRMVSEFAEDVFFYTFTADRASWEVSRFEVGRLLENPLLHSDLAYYFSLLEEVNRLLGLHLELYIGVAHAAPERRANIRKLILEIVSDLRARSTGLLERVSAARKAALSDAKTP